MESKIYRRNLPHWHPEGAAIFLTWRLFDSLPAIRLGQHGAARMPHESPGKRFALLDAALDKSQEGPRWLKNPDIAQCVIEAIQDGAAALNFYELHAYVVMPNHIHLLITPKVAVSRITNGLKGVTARQANRLLNRRGVHFWQDESFDHWIRNPGEFFKIKTYIEGNPVSAGLADRPEHWPWSSAAHS